MVNKTEDSSLIRQVYAGALRRDPEERAQYLDRACANKPHLRELVQALLEADPVGSAQTATVSPPLASEEQDAQPQIEGRLGECGRIAARIRFLTPASRLRWQSDSIAVASAIRGVAARNAMHHSRWHGRLYLLNSALLFTHEVDSAFWHEWEMFALPGGLPGFLAANLALFVLALIGFRGVLMQTPRWRYWAIGLASAGLVAFVLHAGFLLSGRPEFREPASLIVLGLVLVVSLVQLGAVARRRPTSATRSGSQRAIAARN